MKIKKILVILFALIMVCSMIACADDSQVEEDPNQIQAQRWAIAIDYGYPGEQDEESANTSEAADPDQPDTVEEVNPGEVSEVTPGESSEVNSDENPDNPVDEPQLEPDPDDLGSDETRIINDGDIGGALGAIAAVGTTFYVIMLLVCVVMIVAQWKMFKIAGEAGWKSIVPILNTITMSKIVWGNPWRIFLTLVPIYGIIVAIKTSLATARVYGCGIGIGILMIVAPPIGQAIIAFNPKSDYQGPEEF